MDHMQTPKPSYKWLIEPLTASKSYNWAVWTISNAHGGRGRMQIYPVIKNACLIGINNLLVCVSVPQPLCQALWTLPSASPPGIAWFNGGSIPWPVFAAHSLLLLIEHTPRTICLFGLCKQTCICWITTQQGFLTSTTSDVPPPLGSPCCLSLTMSTIIYPFC